MKEKIVDRKNWLIYAFWSRVNALLLALRFRKIEIINRHLIPTDRPFILVSNHITRWDGLLVYRIINRPSNFMVSPNELRGFQGSVLQSMGAFPASARLDLQEHVKKQLAKREGVVIFPEGDVYRDGTTHKFKSGAARLALKLGKDGEDVPLVPIAITYSSDGKTARVMVAQPVSAGEYAEAHSEQPMSAVKALTDRLQREVCHLRMSLGVKEDAAQLFTAKVNKSWAGDAVSV
jgi:1-acyl-sn-glycerol-3-phosphate acyltransferase